jgi:hypothetical protein
VSCSTPHRDSFCHEALFYSDGDELLAGTVPFLREGLEAGEAILVAMPEANLDLLRGNLNGEAGQIQFVNMEELGRNPARIIVAWREFLGEHHSEDRGVRGIGEPIWAGRSAAELDECRRHESLLNLAFADSPAWSLLCPYDTAGLDDEVLAAAEHNHPVLAGRSARPSSPSTAGKPSPGSCRGRPGVPRSLSSARRTFVGFATSSASTLCRRGWGNGGSPTSFWRPMRSRPTPSATGVAAAPSKSGGQVTRSSATFVTRGSSTIPSSAVAALTASRWAVADFGSPISCAIWCRSGPMAPAA